MEDSTQTIQILLEQINKFKIQVDSKDDQILKLIIENVGLKNQLSKLNDVQPEKDKSTATLSFICLTVIFMVLCK